jgi:methylmalonyl-CoA mutase cobalamin-binding domain/chain
MHQSGRTATENTVRFVTAASLFDGHDAAINIMRRILQAHGAEVIHLGHNRSVREIVDAAIQEDAQGIAVSSYQGGHVEFFRYMIDLLRERGAGHVKVFGGGGGVIVPDEIAELQEYGVTRIFSPEDGRRLGLDGMIAEMVRACDFDPAAVEVPADHDPWLEVSRAITAAEAQQAVDIPKRAVRAPVLGTTGTGGAGKSSLTDELVLRFLADFPELKIAILSVDPTKRKTGGALLGDRIRLNSSISDRVYMRSLATRQAHRALSAHIETSIEVCQGAGFDLIIVESSGIGQADSEIVDISDVSLYVMTPEYGAAMQLEKIDMLDYADFVAINKFDRPGALDALRDVRKQYRRCHELFDGPEDEAAAGLRHLRPSVPRPWRQWSVPQPDPAVHGRLGCGLAGGQSAAEPTGLPESHPVIPADRAGYLRDISRTVRDYKRWAEAQIDVAARLYQLVGARAILCGHAGSGSADELFGTCLRRSPRRRSPARPQLADLDAEIRRIAHELEDDSRKLHRGLAQDQCRLLAVGVHLHRTRPGDPCAVDVDLAGRHRGAQGPASAARDLAGDPALPVLRERARRLSLHRRRLPPQAHSRAAHPDVRGRGRPRSAPTALPLAGRRPARNPPVHRLRLGDPVRRGPRRTTRHLGQGGREPGCPSAPWRTWSGSTPASICAPDHLGLHDHQRPGAHDPGHVLQRRRPPAGAQAPDRERPPEGPARGRLPPGGGRQGLGGAGAAARGRRVGRDPQRHHGRCAAPSRPTSSRRTRPRTPASSPPSSRSDDGRHPAVLHRQRRCATSTRCRSPATTSPRPAPTPSPSSPSPWPTASPTSSTTSPAA